MKSRDYMFWEKVDQLGPTECWPWKASTNKDGYGQFWIGYTFVPAHRYAFAYKSKQAIPKGILVCHHCDNPKCCNPNHLFLGTIKDNMEDKIRKGRQGNPMNIIIRRGSSHHNAHLSEMDVLEIRRLAKSGTKQIKLSKIYKVSTNQISLIVRGINWRHI
jgi:hypothetical protein